MIEKHTAVISKLANNQGLTIIEIVFAFSIFAIGILAVSMLAIGSVNSNASSRMVTEATTLAEDCLEKLMTQSYEDVDTGNEKNGPYDVSWNVTENVAEKSKSITVTVTRPGALKEIKVAISQFISSNG